MCDDLGVSVSRLVVTLGLLSGAATGCGSNGSRVGLPDAATGVPDAPVDTGLLADSGTVANGASCPPLGDGALYGSLVDPYTSADAQLEPLLSGAYTSFYLQPWRAYLETVPATQLLDGIGVNFGGLMSASGGNEANVVKLLADAGMKTFRIEVPWNSVTWDEAALTTNITNTLSTALDACRTYGITPVLLLNANSGGPTPSQNAVATVKTAAGADATQIVLTSTSGFVVSPNGGPNSGLDLPDYPQAGILFTSIDASTGMVRLSQPLPAALAAGATVNVSTLKHLPFYPTGTPQYQETLSGWLRYATLVGQLASAHVPAFEIEIWNELSFGSAFVSINNYYSPPVVPSAPDGLEPGGAMWEMAHATGQLMKSQFPAMKRVIWGFSNTTFFHTPISNLPPEIDGQSYHPYGTGPGVVCSPADFEAGVLPCYPSAKYMPMTLEHYAPFGLTRCMPEGWAHQGEQLEEIIRLLYPPTRATEKPDGSTSSAPFVHYFTEDGLNPGSLGITDTAAAQETKAKMMLRAFLFWLNKGLTRLEMFEAYESNESGFGLLAASPPAASYDGGAEDDFLGVCGSSIRRMVQAFAGATALTTPRALTLAAASQGPDPIAFAGDAGTFPPDAMPTEAGHPDFPYRDMLAFLPFQVTDTRFVAGLYVMSWDIRSPPPPMQFQMQLGPLQSICPKVSYYDPLTDAALPVTVLSVDPVGKTASIQLEVTDGARLLTIDDSP